MNDQTLPDTIYGLLAVAIADAKAISRRIYLPHFGYWHRPLDNGKCQVCLAGSVLARSLGFPTTSIVSTSILSSELQRKMDAINAMRHGNWLFAYDLIYSSRPDPATLNTLLSLPTPAQCDFIGWRQFNAHLKSMQRILPRLRALDDHSRSEGATP